nr:Hpt domain-containing protein [Pseudopontixanthobacter vadosimaris]
MFAERKENALTAVEAALSERDFSQARRLDIAAMLHQIAGVAAYFGDPDLGEAASGLEHALKDATNGINAAGLLEDLRQRLAA